MLFYVFLVEVVLSDLVIVVVNAFLCFWLCVVQWQRRRLGHATCQPAFASCGLRGDLGGVCYDLV